MSIWCSWRTIGHDEDDEDPQRGEVRSYAYGWGNHYPTTDGQVEQPANVELAYLPAICVPGHQDEVDVDEDMGPWLRLYMTSRQRIYINGEPIGRKSAAVVIDEAAARHLAADLLEWANWPKVHPGSTP